MMTTPDVWRNNVENIEKELKRRYPEPKYKVHEPHPHPERKVAVFNVDDQNGNEVERFEILHSRLQDFLLPTRGIELLVTQHTKNPPPETPTRSRP